MTELLPMPDAQCDNCGKVPKVGDVFLTEYACSRACLNALSEEQKEAAKQRWTAWYRKNGWYAP